MPFIHPDKDIHAHEETLTNAVEVLHRELAGTKVETDGKKSHKQSEMRHKHSNDSLEHYSELSRQLEEDFKATNETERKENLKKQQEHHELIIKEIKTTYKDRSTTSKLKARNFRSQNLKEAAYNAGSQAQAYLREANFLMQRLGSMVYNRDKIQNDIDGNIKTSARYNTEADRLNSAADKVMETPIEEED